MFLNFTSSLPSLEGTDFNWKLAKNTDFSTRERCAEWWIDKANGSDGTWQNVKWKSWGKKTLASLLLFRDVNWTSTYNYEVAGLRIKKKKMIWNVSQEAQRIWCLESRREERKEQSRFSWPLSLSSVVTKSCCRCRLGWSRLRSENCRAEGFPKFLVNDRRVLIDELWGSRK